MRKSGHISAFLALIIVCICGLLCGLLETVRTAAAGCYAKTAVCAAVDSVFGGYHRELWKQYRIAALEYGSIGELEEQIKSYIEEYDKAENFYPMHVLDVKIESKKALSEGSGNFLKHEILDYMKYGVWQIENNADKALEIKERENEALSLEKISKAYKTHEKKIAKLEKAAKAIKDSLDYQQEKLNEGLEYLYNHNGAAFRSSGEKLLKELNKIPLLMRTYEKIITELKGEMSKTSAELLTDETENFNKEVLPYDKYLIEEKERNNELKVIVSESEKNSAIVKRAIEKSIEVEKIISEQDEDEETDEDELWQDVINILTGCSIRKILSGAGMAQPEKQDALERIEAVIEKDILMQVLPGDYDVSTGRISMADLPSGMKETEDGNNDILELLIIHEYCRRFFSCFTTEDRKDFQYEIEYILHGKEDDRANLKETAESLLRLREGMNMIYILSDEEKRNEAELLAAAITGAAGLPALVHVTAFFVMGVWAKAEAVYDLRILFKNGRVSFFKSKDTWRVGINEIFEICDNRDLKDIESSDSGLEYSEYLKLMLMLKSPETVYYRMMDMIQINIRRKQSWFLINKCLYSAEVRSEIEAKRVFLNLFPVAEMIGHRENKYKIEVKAEKAY